MKNIYEELTKNPDYVKHLSNLSDAERGYIEGFAINLSKYADDMLINIFKGLGSTKVTEEEVERAIRDRTGGV